MTGGQPHSDPVLTQDLWHILFNQAHLFATKYINRLRWRGSYGGVLPDGDDAESIAAQAVIDFLNRSRVKLASLHRQLRLPPPSTGSLSLRESDRVRASFPQQTNFSISASQLFGIWSLSPPLSPCPSP